MSGPLTLTKIDEEIWNPRGPCSSELRSVWANMGKHDHSWFTPLVVFASEFRMWTTGFKLQLHPLQPQFSRGRERSNRWELHQGFVGENVGQTIPTEWWTKMCGNTLWIENWDSTRKRCTSKMMGNKHIFHRRWRPTQNGWWVRAIESAGAPAWWCGLFKRRVWLNLIHSRCGQRYSKIVLMTYCRLTSFQNCAHKLLNYNPSNYPLEFLTPFCATLYWHVSGYQLLLGSTQNEDSKYGSWVED